MVSGEQTITSAIAAKLKCFFILIESLVCFPRLSVVLFFFSQAFSLQSQKDTFLLYHCSTNLWVDCKKQNFEIHLRYYSEIIFFTLFSNVFRGIITILSHPQHFNLKSAPVRMIFHWFVPQGWPFFSVTIFPILYSTI